ncbi:hypothetical protein [Methylomicrobium lacus]|uniref:hypothetical protein n=1 Tax=Methylomicrobium lacus TaxID=136992 RepID=UPI0035A852C3
MPPWLIFVILLVLFAMSSKDKDIRQAEKRATEGYRHNAAAAQKARKDRLDQCGDRCKDIKNDYTTPVANE